MLLVPKYNNYTLQSRLLKKRNDDTIRVVLEEEVPLRVRSEGVRLSTVPVMRPSACAREPMKAGGVAA